MISLGNPAKFNSQRTTVIGHCLSEENPCCQPSMLVPPAGGGEFADWHLQPAVAVVGSSGQPRQPGSRRVVYGRCVAANVRVQQLEMGVALAVGDAVREPEI